MAKVLSEDEIKDILSNANAGVYLTAEEGRDLIATIRAKDAEIRGLNKVMVDESAQWRSRELWKQSYETLTYASRDFLQAFRAHWVFDRTEEFNVTANRLRETEARLASLLEEGETNAHTRD